MAMPGNNGVACGIVLMGAGVGTLSNMFKKKQDVGRQLQQALDLDHVKNVNGLKKETVIVIGLALIALLLLFARAYCCRRQVLAIAAGEEQTQPPTETVPVTPVPAKEEKYLQSQSQPPRGLCQEEARVVESPGLSVSPSRGGHRSALQLFMPSNNKSERGMTMVEIRDTFEHVKEVFNIEPNTSNTCQFPFQVILQTIQGKQGPQVSHTHQRFFEHLDKKQRHEATKSKVVVIVGGGPNGLRLAIELRLSGHNVIVLEKRKIEDADIRLNRLHLWPSMKKDLEGLGSNTLLSANERKPLKSPEYGHIGIGELQRMLYQVALLFGVQVSFDTEYVDAKAVDGPELDAQWRVQTKSGEIVFADVLVGADGRGAVLNTHKALGNASETVFQEAIGVVANFNRKPGLQNHKEFAKSGQFYRPFFDAIKQASGLKLENCVHYVGPLSHYLIITPTRASLTESDVDLSHWEDEPQQKTNLKRVVQKLMLHLEIDHDGFVEDKRNDLMWFKFSNTLRASKSIVYEENEHKVITQPPVLLIGDCLCEPFWPEGLGIIRGFLAAQDAAWAINNIGGLAQKEIESSMAEAFKGHKALNSRTAESLLKHTGYGDPASRYRYFK